MEGAEFVTDTAERHQGALATSLGSCHVVQLYIHLTVLTNSWDKYLALKLLRAPPCLPAAILSIIWCQTGSIKKWPIRFLAEISRLLHLENMLVRAATVNSNRKFASLKTKSMSWKKQWENAEQNNNRLWAHQYERHLLYYSHLISCYYKNINKCNFNDKYIKGQSGDLPLMINILFP